MVKSKHKNKKKGRPPLQLLYRREIERISRKLVDSYKPERIILFGSCAHGKVTEDSDIDMLIIKKTKKRRIDRIKEVLFTVDNDLPFEPLVYTPQELKRRQAMGDFFVQDVLKEGKIIYEK